MTKAKHNHHKPTHDEGHSKADPAAQTAESAVTPDIAPDREPDMPEQKAAADSPEFQPEGPSGEVESSLESLQIQIMHLRADYENYRKRVIREKSEIFEQANSDLIARLLPVLDNALLGAEAGGKHDADKAILEGFQMIIQQFTNVLADFGLSRIETEGKTFDPLVHEAVSVLPSDTIPEGVIMVEIRRGYMLKKRLIRAAQVIVSSGPAAAASTVESAAKE